MLARQVSLISDIDWMLVCVCVCMCARARVWAGERMFAFSVECRALSKCKSKGNIECNIAN